MKPARRHRRVVLSKRKKFPFLKPLFFIALVFLLGFFFLRSAKYWNGRDKLSLAVETPAHDIEVITFNPSDGQIATIFIPGDTQVEVGKGLGVWKLSSVRELGVSQKISGSLVPVTLAKNFGFPVYVWADSPARGFVDGGIGSLVRAVFMPYATNMRLGDKIRLGLFVLGVKNINRTTFDLADAGVLKKTSLKDGSRGYILSSPVPVEITAIFADQLANENLKMEIIDGTERSDTAEEVGRIVQALGPKIALVQKAEVPGNVCQVSGKFNDLNRKVAMIFGCQIKKTARDNFDLVISLPKAFPESF